MARANTGDKLMVYDTKKKSEIVSVDDCIDLFCTQLESERRTMEIFLSNARELWRTQYNSEIIDIDVEVRFDLKEYGFSYFIPDAVIKDDRGISTIIEAKNPKQLKENIVGLAQLMNAKMAFDYHGIKNNYMLITSVFSPFIMKFILEYNLPFDLCMVSNKNMALWRMYENI